MKENVQLLSIALKSILEKKEIIIKVSPSDKGITTTLDRKQCFDKDKWQSILSVFILIFALCVELDKIKICFLSFTFFTFFRDL